MRDDLVTEEIEIDPVAARAPFGTAEQAGIERARLREVVHRKGKMEARAWCHRRFS